MAAGRTWGALILLLPLCVEAGVSPDEAQDLPLGELAHRVLGDVGALMIDVERPAWGERYWRLPETTPWPPDEPPPFTQLRFFGRGTAAGSQFGICGSDWITVRFKEDGSVESVEAERRYGVEADVYARPENWTHEQYGAICDAVTSTRHYFPAPGPQEAERIANYVDVIAGRGPFAGQDFGFTCTGACRAERGVLRELTLEGITAAREIDCPGSALQLPSCFELTVDDGRVGPNPKRFRLYGSNYLNKVIVRQVSVDVGFTVQ